MAHVFMSTFNDESMSTGCVGNLGGQSGFLQHYRLSMALLICVGQNEQAVTTEHCIRVLEAILV